MKTDRTHLATALAALGLLALAPFANADITATPQHQAPAQETADAPANGSALDALNKLDPAVRNYMLTAISKTLELQGQSPANGQADPIALVCAALEVTKDIPTDKLPAEYQNYIKESIPIANRLLDELKASPSGDRTRLVEAIRKSQAEVAALKAKYPKAAAVMESVDPLAQDLVRDPFLQQKAMEYLMENSAVLKGKSQEEITKAVMLFLSKEIAKLAK